jgi:hypothetical protein
MDPGFYQDLTGQHYGLPIVLQDRIDCEDAQVIHQFTGARQDALALGEIAQTVSHRQIGTTVRVHVGVLALAGLADLQARANKVPSGSEFVRELAAHG